MCTILCVCTPAVSNASVLGYSNPTAFWECWDSLISLGQDSAFAEDVQILLDHFPELKITLDRAQELIPSQKFFIDVWRINDSLTQEQKIALIERIKKQQYNVVGAETVSMISDLTKSYKPFRTVVVSDSLCVALFDKLKSSSDGRLVTIRELIQKVQTEYCLVTIGLAMKAYRGQSGKIWRVDAIIVSRELLHIEHFNNLLTLFKVESLRFER
jgi:hypothetical protein